MKLKLHLIVIIFLIQTTCLLAFLFFTLTSKTSAFEMNREHVNFCNAFYSDIEKIVFSYVGSAPKNEVDNIAKTHIEIIRDVLNETDIKFEVLDKEHAKFIDPNTLHIHYNYGYAEKERFAIALPQDLYIFWYSLNRFVPENPGQFYGANEPLQKIVSYGDFHFKEVGTIFQNGSEGNFISPTNFFTRSKYLKESKELVCNITLDSANKVCSNNKHKPIVDEYILSDTSSCIPYTSEYYHQNIKEELV